MQDFIRINECDNVIVALNTIPSGTHICLDNSFCFTVNEEIPAGHKIAISYIPAGGKVIKYGYQIGNATEEIYPGDWIHVHNLKTALGDLLEYTYEPVSTEEHRTEDTSFMGFVRPDGKVGVRNEIWVIPTVGCVNNVATAIAKQANAFVKGSVDEVIAYPHPYGCSQMGYSAEPARKVGKKRSANSPHLLFVKHTSAKQSDGHEQQRNGKDKQHRIQYIQGQLKSEQHRHSVTNNTLKHGKRKYGQGVPHNKVHRSHRRCVKPLKQGASSVLGDHRC